MYQNLNKKALSKNSLNMRAAQRYCKSKILVWWSAIRLMHTVHALGTMTWLQSLTVQLEAGRTIAFKAYRSFWTTQSTMWAAKQTWLADHACSLSQKRFPARKTARRIHKKTTGTIQADCAARNKKAIVWTVSCQNKRQPVKVSYAIRRENSADKNATLRSP